MTRFTARAFRRRVSRKMKKSRRLQTRRRGLQKRGQVYRTPTVGGGDTFSREIPKNAVLANVVEWDD